MNAYYAVTQKLYTELLDEVDINSVTKGDITRIDINKKNIFPLAHVFISDAEINTQTIIFSVQVFAMNLRHELEETISDKFIGNDNEDDNLNAMLYVLVRLHNKILKFGEDFRVLNTPTLEAFTEEQENVVDGWVMSFQVEYPISEIDNC